MFADAPQSELDMVHAALRDELLEPKLQAIFKRNATKGLREANLIKNYKMSFQTFQKFINQQKYLVDSQKDQKTLEGIFVGQVCNNRPN